MRHYIDHLDPYVYFNVYQPLSVVDCMPLRTRRKVVKMGKTITGEKVIFVHNSNNSRASMVIGQCRTVVDDFAIYNSLV